jgi:hypothetical protein
MQRISAKDFFRYTCGIALIICSVALLIFSITANSVKAAPVPRFYDQYTPIGVVVKDNKIMMVGYRYSDGHYNTKVLSWVQAADLFPAP